MRGAATELVRAVWRSLPVQVNVELWRMARDVARPTRSCENCRQALQRPRLPALPAPRAGGQHPAAPQLPSQRPAPEADDLAATRDADPGPAATHRSRPAPQLW